MISLGFTPEPFPAGVHICQVYADDAERDESLHKFLAAGLQAGERCACFSDHTTASRVIAYAAGGEGACACCQPGALTVAPTRDIYLCDQRFDPERMLANLVEFHEESARRGYAAARVIGEMAPEVQHAPGGSRLLEYESRVSLLLRDRPITTVCQYDGRAFDGATILDVLKVHPLMIVRGMVVRNPFYIPPETFLAQ